MLLNVASVVDKRWKARALLFISKESASYPGRVSLLRYQKPRWKILENLRFFKINMNINILTIKLKKTKKLYHAILFFWLTLHSLFCCHFTLLLLIFFYCIWNYAVFPVQKKQLINLHNIYIREHVRNVGIYLLICMQLFNNHF